MASVLGVGLLLVWPSQLSAWGVLIWGDVNVDCKQIMQLTGGGYRLSEAGATYTSRVQLHTRTCARYCRWCRGRSRSTNQLLCFRSVWNFPLSRCSSVPFIALLLCRVISRSFINSLRVHRFTSSDIASTFTPDKQMGWIRDPQGGPGTQPLCSVLISCRGLRVKDRRWKSDWVVEISRFTWDNRLSIGKRAHVRNSFTIRTSYWPVAYDPRPAQYA